jgi:hypothetical protein
MDDSEPEPLPIRVGMSLEEAERVFDCGDVGAHGLEQGDGRSHVGHLPQRAVCEGQPLWDRPLLQRSAAIRSGIIVHMAEETHREKPPCAEQQRLMAVVQGHLIEISKLTRATAEALANGNENFAAEVDKLVDIEFGKKERAMGALHQHRKDHGC